MNVIFDCSFLSKSQYDLIWQKINEIGNLTNLERERIFEINSDL